MGDLLHVNNILSVIYDVNAYWPFWPFKHTVGGLQRVSQNTVDQNDNIVKIGTLV